MGDRGGTATPCASAVHGLYYTRWEIGGEPQPRELSPYPHGIIPDGRSGGNRNLATCNLASAPIIPDGRSGGNRNMFVRVELDDVIIPDGRSGGNRN